MHRNVAKEWRERAQWIESETVKADAVEVAEFPDISTISPGNWWWLASMQLAKSRGVPLYCDDAWTRRVAASMGVRAFGTVNLLGFLSATGWMTPADVERAIEALRRRGAVSIPMSQSALIDLARLEGWGDGVACLQLAQSGYWALPDGLATYDSLVALVARNNDQALPAWVAAACFGAARLAAPPARKEIVARFFASAIAAYVQPHSVQPLIDAARLLSKRLEIDDPLTGIAVIVRDLLVSRFGQRNAALAVTTLIERLEPADRAAFTLSLFTPGATN